MDRRRREHGGEHGQWALRIEGFSHPACAGVEARWRQRCPLLSRKWGRIRDCSAGVELRLEEENPDLPALRRHMLCHMAFGRTGVESSCPLHLEGVRVQSERIGSSWVFRILTEDPGRVSELRTRMRRLLR